MRALLTTIAGLVMAGSCAADPNDLQAKLPGKGKIEWKFDKLGEGKFWNPLDAKNRTTQVVFKLRLEAPSLKGNVILGTYFENLRPLTYTFRDAADKSLASGTLTFLPADGKTTPAKAALTKVKTGDQVLAVLVLPKPNVLSKTKSVVIEKTKGSFVKKMVDVTLYTTDGFVAPIEANESTKKKIVDP